MLMKPECRKKSTQKEEAKEPGPQFHNLYKVGRKLGQVGPNKIHETRLIVSKEANQNFCAKIYKKKDIDEEKLDVIK